MVVVNHGALENYETLYTITCEGANHHAFPSINAALSSTPTVAALQVNSHARRRVHEQVGEHKFVQSQLLCSFQTIIYLTSADHVMSLYSYATQIV